MEGVILTSERRGTKTSPKDNNLFRFELCEIIFKNKTSHSPKFNLMSKTKAKSRRQCLLRLIHFKYKLILGLYTSLFYYIPINITLFLEIHTMIHNQGTFFVGFLLLSSNHKDIGTNSMFGIRIHNLLEIIIFYLKRQGSYCILTSVDS